MTVTVQDGKVVITSVSEGTAKVAVKRENGDTMAVITVTVNSKGDIGYSAEKCEASVTGVTITADKTSVEVGETATLIASVSGELDYSDAVNWTFSEGYTDTINVTISGNVATITGKAPGSVTASAASVADPTKSDSKKLSVYGLGEDKSFVRLGASRTVDFTANGSITAFDGDGVIAYNDEKQTAEVKSYLLYYPVPLDLTKESVMTMKIKYSQDEGGYVGPGAISIVNNKPYCLASTYQTGGVRSRRPGSDSWSGQGWDTGSDMTIETGDDTRKFKAGRTYVEKVLITDGSGTSGLGQPFNKDLFVVEWQIWDENETKLLASKFTDVGTYFGKENPQVFFAIGATKGDTTENTLFSDIYVTMDDEKHHITKAEDGDLSNLTLSTNILAIEKGETKPIGYVALNKKGESVSVTVTSENPAVATAAVDGDLVKITGVAAGVTKITVANASNPDMTDVINVTVSDFATAKASYVGWTVTPAVNSTNVYPDAELKIGGFAAAPSLLEGGQVQIHDAVTGEIVDVIKYQNESQLYGADSTGRVLNVGDQLVRVDSEEKAVYVKPHTDVLENGKTYYLAVSDKFITGKIGTEDFAGLTNDKTKAVWKFTVRASEPEFSTEGGTIKVDADQSKTTADFRTIQGALRAAYKTSLSANWVIAIEPGTYHENVYYGGTGRIVLSGQSGTDNDYSDGSGSVKIVYENGAALNNQEATRNLITWAEGAGDLVLENLEIDNTYSRAKYSGDAQAEALGYHATKRVAAYNCAFKSYQDTVRTRGKGWLYGCYISGDTDFTWMETGSSVLLIEKSNLLSRFDANSKEHKSYITAPRLDKGTYVGKGLVIFNSDIAVENGTAEAKNTAYFGRSPWPSGYYSQAAFINNKVTYDTTKADFVADWTTKCEAISDFSNVGWKQYGNTVNGTSVTAVTTDPAVSVILTEAQKNKEYAGRNNIINRVFDTSDSTWYKDSVNGLWDVAALATERSWNVTADSSKYMYDDEPDVYFYSGTKEVTDYPEVISDGFAKEKNKNHWQGQTDSSISIPLEGKAIVSVTGYYQGKGTISCNAQGDYVEYDFNNNSTSETITQTYTVYTDNPGSVEIKAAGTSYITVIKVLYSDDITYNAVTGVTVKSEGDATEVKSGKTLQFTAEIAPATATNKAVKWNVSPADAATIDSKGLLTAETVDNDTEVTVTATSYDKSGLSGTKKITVKAPDAYIPQNGDLFTYDFGVSGWQNTGYLNNSENHAGYLLATESVDSTFNYHGTGYGITAGKNREFMVEFAVPGAATISVYPSYKGHSGTLTLTDYAGNVIDEKTWTLGNDKESKAKNNAPSYPADGPADGQMLYNVDLKYTKDVPATLKLKVANGASATMYMRWIQVKYTGTPSSAETLYEADFTKIAEGKTIVPNPDPEKSGEAIKLYTSDEDAKDTYIVDSGYDGNTLFDGVMNIYSPKGGLRLRQNATNDINYNGGKPDSGLAKTEIGQTFTADELKSLDRYVALDMTKIEADGPVTVSYAFKAITSKDATVDQGQAVLIDQNNTILASVSRIKLKSGDDTRVLTATVDPSEVTNVKLWFSRGGSGGGGIDVTGISLKTPGASGAKVENVSLDETSLDLLVGDSATLTATPDPSDVENRVTVWRSSDSGVATVCFGKVTAVKAGTATITAKIGNKTATCTVTVTSPEKPATSVKIYDSSDAEVDTAQIATGKTITLSAKALPEDTTDVIAWDSSDEEEEYVGLDVNETTGVVTLTGKKATSTPVTITVTAGSQTATCTVNVIDCSVEVSPKTLVLSVNGTESLSAEVSPTDSDYSWTSEDPTVAEVEDGTVKGKKVGTTIVKASLDDFEGVEDSADIYVAELTFTGEELKVGTTKTLNLSSQIQLNVPENQDVIRADSEIEWIVDDGTYAEISDGGILIGKTVGNVNVTAKVKDYPQIFATAEVTVEEYVGITSFALSKTNATVSVNGTLSLNAVDFNPDNATYKTVTWASSDEGVAVVSNDGVVTGVHTGTATITATTTDPDKNSGEGAVKASCEINVVMPVTTITLDELGLTSAPTTISVNAASYDGYFSYETTGNGDSWKFKITPVEGANMDAPIKINFINETESSSVKVNVVNSSLVYSVLKYAIWDFTTMDASAINYNGTSGYGEPNIGNSDLKLYIDASTGKLLSRGTTSKDAQCNAGTVIYVPAKAGSVVKYSAKKGYLGSFSINDDDTVSCIRVTESDLINDIGEEGVSYVKIKCNKNAYLVSISVFDYDEKELGVQGNGNTYTYYMTTEGINNDEDYFTLGTGSSWADYKKITGGSEESVDIEGHPCNKGIKGEDAPKGTLSFKTNGSALVTVYYGNNGIDKTADIYLNDELSPMNTAGSMNKWETAVETAGTYTLKKGANGQYVIMYVSVTEK